MMMLLSFDLPRDRKRLVELGFSMNQYSLYEREVQSNTTRNRLIEILKKEIPDSGLITLYLLPDEVNNKQITILGKDAPKITVGAPHLIVL